MFGSAEIARPYRTLRVPIITDTPFEEDLTDSMAAAMEKYPEAAVILGDTGSTCGVHRAVTIFFQGISDVDFPEDDWKRAKTQTEVHTCLVLRDSMKLLEIVYCQCLDCTT